MNNSDKITIAIDGPAGSGKSTTARLVAQKLGYIYIDTGAMYRAVALAWLRDQIEQTDENMIRLMEKNPVSLKQSEAGQKTFLGDEDVSSEIRTAEVTQWSSPISAIQSVRKKMVELQRDMGKDGGVVMDGRDIGTVVFPNAELKIFLTASIKARAERRRLELMKKGEIFSVDDIAEQIRIRDNNDSTRENSPLKQADDAVLLDTSELSIDEQVGNVIELAKKAMERVKNEK